MRRSHPAFRTWWPILVLLLVGAAFLLPGLGRPVMNREQELRVALTARVMADGGDWLRPEFLGESRLRKPPLMYWAVAVSYLTAGTTSSPTVARMPSAVAGLLLLALVYACTAPSLGRRRALVAALICGTSFVFIKQARLAETDTLLCLGTTAAALALYHALTHPGTRSAWWLAGLASGLGFLTKGPAALVLPAAAALVFVATTPVARRAATPARVAISLLIFALIALPWYVLILQEGAGLTQVRDELARAAATSEHPGPPYYYAYTIIHATAPWGLALPGALWWAWRRRGQPLLRFALGWLGSSVLILSLLESKQLHYALLVVPPASLLLSSWLGSGWSGRGQPRASANRMWAGFAWITLAAGLVTLGAAAWGDHELPFRPLVITGLYATLAGGAAVWLRRSPALRMALVLCACLALTWCASIRIMPALARERVIEEAVLGAQGALQQASHIIYCGPRNAIAEFYADRPLEVVMDPARAWRKARPSNVVIMVGPPDQLHLPVEPALLKTNRKLSCAILVKPAPVN